MTSTVKGAVPALERGLAILETLARSRGGLTLSQLTRALKLPKSSAFCLLRTLEQSGYLWRDTESGRYTITLRICNLASMALNANLLREKARPHLRRLSKETGLTVHLALLESSACVLIEKLAADGTCPVATWVGKHLSWHCTAIGKAVAAYLPEEEVSALLREQGLMRHNDNTICSWKRLKQELELVRQRRYAVDDEEEEMSIRCVAAPLLSGSMVFGGLSLVGSTNEIHGGTLEALSASVIQTAEVISSRIHQASAKLLAQ